MLNLLSTTSTFSNSESSQNRVMKRKNYKMLMIKLEVREYLSVSYLEKYKKEKYHLLYKSTQSHRQLYNRSFTLLLQRTTKIKSE